MKIRRIEFENFRNFKEKNQIDFATDGSVTIIYGPNGVGKTTLHQLFQWIFYGEVHFNKTASKKMYNLQLESELPYGKQFSVVGSIQFEHPNKQGVPEFYNLRREWKYVKEAKESKKVKEYLSLIKKVGDDWKPVADDPSTAIEQILPKGLSQYFFFDGESMIADLNQTGKDSAKALRKALFSIFDLDIYELAIQHLGTRQASSSTVIGKLYSSRSANTSNNNVIILRGKVNECKAKIEKLNGQIATADKYIKKNREEIQELSEKIGSSQSLSVLEKRRSAAKKAIKGFENSIEVEKKSFGKKIADVYPYLMLSKMIKDAQLRIGLKVEEEKLLPGLTKQLLETLKNEEVCICGTHLGIAQRESLDKHLAMFPPLSYKYIYDQFKNSAMRWSATYDPDALITHIGRIFELKEQIEVQLSLIHDIEEEQKQSVNVEEFVQQRKKAEDSLNIWEKDRSNATKELVIQERYLTQRMKAYDDALATSDANKEIDAQIALMEEVRTVFEEKLETSAVEYSKRLCDNIQSLVNAMLTSKRKVSMTKRFELHVKDNYGDEAKSEGQFAVVSFAYIGGIFKLLSDIPELREKEFPLILDGPFSKLDVVQRQNVINTVPTYAPQIILFSKDDLNSCFEEDISDHVWTIYSNDEKNVSSVKKGYNPEVFKLNGNNN